MDFPASEYADRQFIDQMQFDLLRKQLIHVGLHSPYYARQFKQIGFDPESLSSVEDLRSLPFTSKTDFAQYNDDFLSVGPTRVADYVTTSGTLGTPVSYAITHADLDRLAINEALSLQCAGVQPGDTVILMTTLDKRFMAGLAYMLGCQKLGCALVRTGPGVPAMQWDSIARFNPDHIIAVPSFIPKLLAEASDLGYDPRSTSVKSIICIGEPVRDDAFNLNKLGRRITEQWDVKLYSTYASTEMAAAFTECTHAQGGHLRPDLIYLEVVDEHDQQVASGESGEVVVTTLGVEGTPLVRYRTGDICTLHEEPCACGRHSSRLGPVLGRKQHMIKFKGTTIYPPQIHDVLASVEGIGEYIVKVTNDEFGGDHVQVILPQEEMNDLLSDVLHHAFKSQLRVSPEFMHVPMTTIMSVKYDPASRKPIIFIDERSR